MTTAQMAGDGGRETRSPATTRPHYRHRRLRHPRPFTVLRFNGPHYLTNEVADQVRRQFLAARRRGVAIVSGDWTVHEVTR